MEKGEEIKKWTLPKSYYLENTVKDLDLSNAMWYDHFDIEKDEEMKKLIDNGTIFKTRNGRYFARAKFQHNVFTICPFTAEVSIRIDPPVQVQWTSFEEGQKKN